MSAHDALALDGQRIRRVFKDRRDALHEREILIRQIGDALGKVVLAVVPKAGGGDFPRETNCEVRAGLASDLLGIAPDVVASPLEPHVGERNAAAPRPPGEQQ